MLQLQNIVKDYRTGDTVVRALDGISLTFRKSEFVAVLGASGCGKTTLLNIVGGLDRYTDGDLLIRGKSTKEFRAYDWDAYRNSCVGFVFQSYNLIPHQTVLANVELALTISGVSKKERRQRAVRALEQVGLGNQLHKRPNQMSGGQMQRVAIARALVNDPDILLADEPTGALDSDTSVQVMELLKEVAATRLVIMVTHNPELAQEYASRIVTLRDGLIQTDSDPFQPPVQAPAVHKNMGRSSMSLLTALSLSFNNLRTKKARTLLTSFAGSIGIIGIALILSLSNGVNQYIQSVEEETLSEYPLQIQSTGLDLTSMMVTAASGHDSSSSDQVTVNQSVAAMFSGFSSNDLASFKAFLDSGESGIQPYVSAVEYTYNVSPQIWRIEEDEARQVHPDTSFSAMGLGSAGSSNSLMSMATSTDVFYQMPRSTSLFEEQYEVKAGRWPQSWNECVVVLTAGGSINDQLLYTLGLRDSDELEEMIRQFLAEENVDVPTDDRQYTYDDFLGVEFRLVNAADYYTYDEEYQVWTDHSQDAAYMLDLAQKGEPLTVVGVVQPAEGANATALRSGIAYPASLTERVIDQAAASEIVSRQLEQPGVDVFSGDEFGTKKETEFDMGSLFTVDEKALQKAFAVDESKLTAGLGDSLQLDLTDIDLSGMIDPDAMASQLPELPAPDLAAILSQLDLQISPEGISTSLEKRRRPAAPCRRIGSPAGGKRPAGTAGGKAAAADCGDSGRIPGICPAERLHRPRQVQRISGPLSPDPRGTAAAGTGPHPAAGTGRRRPGPDRRPGRCAGPEPAGGLPAIRRRQRPARSRPDGRAFPGLPADPRSHPDAAGRAAGHHQYGGPGTAAGHHHAGIHAVHCHRRGPGHSEPADRRHEAGRGADRLGH